MVICLFVLSLKGQNQIGLRTSNYSGVNGLELNPSSFSYSPYKWEINIISGGLFFENEYLFVENTNLFDLLTHDGPVLFRSQSIEAQNTEDDPSALYYNYFDANQNISNSFNAFLGLPSIALQYKDFSFGLFANIRSASAVNKLDPDLDYFSLDQWPEGLSKSIDPFSMAGMLWGEIGFNIGYKIKDDQRGQLHIGANLKYLIGYEGFYINSSNTSQVTEILDTFLISGGPYQYGIASGALNEGGYNLNANGNGLGLDIGATYIAKSNDRRPYKWRLGASIIDIGYVDFDENAQEHQFSASDLYDVARNSISDVTTINNLISTASDQFLGDNAESLKGNSFYIYTPTALSLQFDYSINEHWFLGALVNQRLKLSKQMIDRENLYALSARYETARFEAGMPVTLYDGKHLRMGTWIRISFLTIGSDHVNSLFTKEAQFSGSDIYFALKINPFSLKGKQRGRSGSSTPEDCNF